MPQLVNCYSAPLCVSLWAFCNTFRCLCPLNMFVTQHELQVWLIVAPCLKSLLLHVAESNMQHSNSSGVSFKTTHLPRWLSFFFLSLDLSFWLLTWPGRESTATSLQRCTELFIKSIKFHVRGLASTEEKNGFSFLRVRNYFSSNVETIYWGWNFSDTTEMQYRS